MEAGEQSYFTLKLNSMALKSVLLFLVLGLEQQLKHEPARVGKSVIKILTFTYDVSLPAQAQDMTK